jgi:transcriptional regulator with XRE-family HTH domain
MKILEFLRRTRRMSQSMLAEAVDVPQEVISQIERGSVRPKPENLERIAALLLPAGQDPVGLLREVPGSLANVLLQGTPARPTVPSVPTAAGAVSVVP